MIKRHRSAVAAMAFFALLANGPTDAEAEVFSDLFLGAAFTSDTNYDLNGVPVPLSVACVTTCSSAKSVAIGLRVGYWFERYSWLGVAGDFTGYVAGWGIESPIEVKAFPISAVMLLRLGLAKTEELPEGRFQPYVGIGPAMMVTSATRTTGSANPIYSPTLGPLVVTSDTSVDIGLDARLGVRVLASDFISLLAEYRYVRASPSWSLGQSGVPETFSTTYSTSIITLGMGVHFR